MGVGVNAREDGYYATVYFRCFIFYGRQYVSYSIYCIFEEFHSRMRYLSPVLITASMIVTLTNESYVISWVYWALFLSQSNILQIVICYFENY